MGKVRIAGVIEESIVDGPGVRYVIFFQGCAHHCEGCHNPQTWDFKGGREVEISELLKEIRFDRLVKGVTFSGGDPMYQSKEIEPLAEELKALGYSLVLYTGFKFEEVKDNRLISLVDYVIDGEFDQSKKSLCLRYKGSTNQRTIDVKRSLESGSVVEVEL